MTRDLDPTKWVSRGSLIFPSCSRDTPPKRLAGAFTSPLIKVASRAINTNTRTVKTNWKWAGRIFAATAKGEEFATEGIRINTSQQIFWDGAQPSIYQLSYQPHHWLPNCRITVWEYQAPLAELPTPGDIKRYLLKGGTSVAIAPGAWRTTYLLPTGLGQRSFAVVEAFLVNANGDDEAIDVDTRRVGLDFLQITLITESRPPDNSVEILIAVASN